MHGINSKMSLDDYLKSKEGKERHYLTKEDIKMWDNRRIKK